jgi:hypothetical protein
MSAVRDVRDWPLILCGPMLRRVTPEEVCVFVALRQPAEVELLLFGAADNTAELACHPASNTRTLALGHRLHVIAAHRRPLSALTAGTRYFYDLRITRLRNGAEATDTLRTLNDSRLFASEPFASDGPSLLTGAGRVGEADGELPGFRIAGNLDELLVLHGSCRKPHGQGPDMLALADVLRVERHGGSERPQQLILTGDQIYADDVALPLAQLIAATAPLLLTDAASPAGYHGELPEPGAAPADDPPGRPMNDASVAPGDRRAAVATGTGGLSVEGKVAGGHLLYLAEFYAMYLLAWAPSLWPQDAAGALQLSVDETPLADDADRRDELACEAGEQQPRLAAFFATLPQVRRALANTPTLMLFDDHEVTDDWNLRASTAARVRDSPVGRQVVRNALLAYAAFQDWGNRPSVAEPEQPAAYAAGGAGAALLDALRCPPGAAGPLHPPTALPPLLRGDGTAVRHAVEARLGLRSEVGVVPMDWHYCVALPSHLVIALDTRTRRALPTDDGPAAIIDPAHLAAQIDAPRLAYPGRLPLVVAPGPVFDLPPTERIKDDVAPWARIVAWPWCGDFIEYADRETWSGNRGALRALVEHLLPFGRVVLLSGDIHYAFSNDVAAAGGNGQRARLVQLCASALLNEDFKTRLAIPALMHSGDPDDESLIVLEDDPAFDEAIDLALDDALVTALALDDLPRARIDDLHWNRLRLNLGRRLGIALRMPQAHWRGHELLRAMGLVPAPDGRTRALIRYVRAVAAPDGMRPCSGAWVPAPTDTPPDGTFALDPRQAVGVNNLGLVRFDTPDEVSHTLFWVSRNTSGQVIRPWCTEHRLPLAAPLPGEV